MSVSRGKRGAAPSEAGGAQGAEGEGGKDRERWRPCGNRSKVMFQTRVCVLKRVDIRIKASQTRISSDETVRKSAKRV